MNYFCYASSDNFRVARSKTIKDPGDGTFVAIRLPKWAFVLDVFIKVITPYSAGATTEELTVGMVGNGLADDPDGFMTSSHIVPTSAGFSRASSGTAEYAEGAWFNEAAGGITLTATQGDSSNDITCMLFAMYSVLH